MTPNFRAFIVFILVLLCCYSVFAKGSVEEPLTAVQSHVEAPQLPTHHLDGTNVSTASTAPPALYEARYIWTHQLYYSPAQIAAASQVVTADVNRMIREDKSTDVGLGIILAATVLGAICVVMYIFKWGQ